MNYLDTVKFDEEKRKYVDAFGYVIEPLKNIRFTEKGNEELEESYPNFIQLKGMPSTYSYAAITTETSAGNDVSIVLDPKGPNGIVTSVSDFAAPIGKVNQVRLQSDDATSSGIITPQGAGTNVHLDLRAKGAGGELKFHGDLATYLSVSKTPTIKVNSGNPTANLTLQSVGSGSYVTLRNNLAKGTLAVRTDYPADSGVTLEAQSSNASCNILLQPKSGYVSVPAPLYTSNGYMVRRHSTFQQTSAAAEYMVQLDTAMENSFGSNATWSTDTFINTSGVLMKIMVTCTAMPTGAITIDSYSAIKLYASGGGLRYTIGRTNTKWDGTTSRSFTSTAVFPLGPSEYFRWAVYTDNQCYLQGYNGSITGYTQMSIIQIA